MSESDYLGSTQPKIGILIIEQEAQIRALLKMALEPVGYDLLLATDCQEGLALAQEYQGNLALALFAGSALAADLDQTLAPFRALHPPPSILVMTGDIETHKPADLLQQGVVHVVKKPFRLAELIELLRQTLDEKTEG